MWWPGYELDGQKNSIAFLCREQETFPLSQLSGPGLELIKSSRNKYRDSFPGAEELQG